MFVFVEPLYSVIHETFYIMSDAKEFDNGLSRLLAPLEMPSYWHFISEHAKPCKTPASDMEHLSFWCTLNFGGTHF
jgi:hypothetical protein